MATPPRPPDPHPRPERATAERLRTAGGILDRVGAQAASIRVSGPPPEEAGTGPVWTLSWVDAAGQVLRRDYTETDLAQLRERARQRRAPTTPIVPPTDDAGAPASAAAPLSHAERLRTLGQEVERAGARFVWLRTVERGIRVQVEAETGATLHYFGDDELRRLSWERQLLRQPPPEPRRSGCLLWFLPRGLGA